MTERSTRIVAIVAAVAAVTAVVALLVLTYGGDDNARTVVDRPPSPVGKQPAPAGPVGPTTPVTGSPTRYAGSDADVPDDAHDAALDAEQRAAVKDTTRKFLRAWLTPGSPGERTKRIGPYATAELTRLLAMTDRSNIPDAKLQGTPRIVGANPYTAATVTTLTGGQRLRCHLLLDTTGWRVSEILPDAAGPRSPSPTGPRSPSPTGPTASAPGVPSPDTSSTPPPAGGGR